MAESHITPHVELDELTPDEAFAVLGNDIRLDIVRVLWNADAVHQYDDVSDTARTVSFSELRRRVDIDDNGKFNYHLSQLVPHFVRHTEEGYRLSSAGKQIARTVIAVSGPETVDFSTDIDQDCPVCSEPLTAAYEDQWLRISCTGCSGIFGDMAPEGAIFFTNYPVGGLTDRTLGDAFETAFYRCMLDIAYMVRDVCRECAGSITSSITVCDTHETGEGGPCSTCGTQFPLWAEMRCGTCGFAKRLPVEAFVMGMTPVIGFLDELGIDILAPSFDDVVELLQNHVDTTVAADPLDMTVTIRGQAEMLSVSLDAELDVIDVNRHGSATANSQ